jgi:hypothetical protein
VQLWEYLSVEFAWDEDTGQWDADGERAAEDLSDLLADYGAAGWEMIGFAPDRWASAAVVETSGGPWEVQVYRAVFKRPAAPA